MACVLDTTAEASWAAGPAVLHPLHPQHRAGVGFAPVGAQPVPFQGMPPGPSSPSSMNAPLGAAAQSRKPPVEFNHAINYVNKIKVRFRLPTEGGPGPCK